MQNNDLIKEKIAKILTDELHYCYCDNCEFGDWEKYEDIRCGDCNRKYQIWHTAKAITKQIIKEIENAE